MSVASVRVKSALSDRKVKFPVLLPMVTSAPAVVSEMLAAPSTSRVLVVAIAPSEVIAPTSVIAPVESISNPPPAAITAPPESTLNMSSPALSSKRRKSSVAVASAK